MSLKDDRSLESSDVVANCAMNRERRLTGPNSYARDLHFDIRGWLIERIATQGLVSWLDLCCGQALALQDAADDFQRQGLGERVTIVGVDLIANSGARGTHANLQLVQASLASWQPEGHLDLITCVHGLHYIGDKLALICKAARWLQERGRFVANLDLANFKIAGSTSSSRAIAKALRNAGFEFDTRKKILRRDGAGTPSFPYEYLGADDQVGPNSTGQPAVTSHYKKV